MSRVVDLWHRKDRTRTARYGKGSRWQAVYTDGAGGESKSSHKTKDAALAWIRAKEQGRTTDRVVFRDYAEQYAAAQLHHSPNTAENLRLALARAYPYIGDKFMHQIDRATAQAMVTGWANELAASTVQTYVRHVRAVFNMAVHDGLIVRSPFDRVNMPRVARSGKTFMSPDTVTQLYRWYLENDMQLWANIVVFAALTGLRPSEWAGLTVDRVDVVDRVFTVDRQLSNRGGFADLKTESSYRHVTFGDRVAEVLERQTPNHLGLVFHVDGRPVSEHYRFRAWGRAKGVLPVIGSGWHQLRHFHASYLLSQGGSVVAVARRLGHRDATETLRTYGHVLPVDDGLLAGVGSGLF